jgi:hypothetical protein
MIRNEFKFIKVIRELLAFSIVEIRKDVSTYSVYLIIYE